MGRTEAEAVNNYLAPLHKVIDCVTQAVLDVAGGYHAATNPNALTLNRGEPAKLRGDTGLKLSVTQTYEVVRGVEERGPWKVKTLGYIYTLHDSTDKEIAGYHWHPTLTPDVPYAHLHIHRDPSLAKIHFPTERIALEKVLRLLIEQFGVRPGRDDWDEVLGESEAAFHRWRTW